MKTLTKSKYRFDVPYLPLENYKLESAHVRFIPEEMARYHQVIALDKFETNGKSILTIGMVNPKNETAIEILQKKLDCTIRVFHIEIQQWAEAINTSY